MEKYSRPNLKYPHRRNPLKKNQKPPPTTTTKTFPLLLDCFCSFPEKNLSSEESNRSLPYFAVDCWEGKLSFQKGCVPTFSSLCLTKELSGPPSQGPIWDCCCLARQLLENAHALASAECHCCYAVASGIFVSQKKPCESESTE